MPLNAVNINEKKAQLFFFSGIIDGIDHVVARLVAFCRRLAHAFKILHQLCKFCRVKRAFLLATTDFFGLIVDGCDYSGIQYEWSFRCEVDSILLGYESAAFMNIRITLIRMSDSTQLISRGLPYTLYSRLIDRVEKQVGSSD